MTVLTLTVFIARLSGNKFVNFQVIAGHGQPAERLCNKDPFTMKSAEYLAHLFPNSKFLMMIRDGRATVHSIISRQVTITGFDLNDPRQCLGKWNHAIKTMYEVLIPRIFLFLKFFAKGNVELEIHWFWITS